MEAPPDIDRLVDKYIDLCEFTLRNKNNLLARKIRVDATTCFLRVIPNWKKGMLSGITGFYLDDIELILSRLTAYRDSGCDRTGRK